MKISFRDPNGYIYKDNKRIFRAILKKEYEIRYLDSESEDNISHPALINNIIRIIIVIRKNFFINYLCC